MTRSPSPAPGPHVGSPHARGPHAAAHPLPASGPGKARPLVGITADADPERFFLRRPYVAAIAEAGGAPVILPASGAGLAAAARCDALVLSGGDDPRTEAFGVATHPRATPLEPDRQAFELAILDDLDRRDVPVLGICLGMQLMSLHAGGALDQHLPDACPTAARHWGHRPHPVDGWLGAGVVDSHHRQAVVDPGRLAVAARADDGLIEAVRDPDRRFFLGVQWHPERTADPGLGTDLLAALVAAVRT